jgi:hypothetical protein
MKTFGVIFSSSSGKHTWIFEKFSKGTPRSSKMPVDKERILYLLGEIEKALSILEEFQQETKERILGDPKSLGAIKYYFVVAIEGCASVGNHNYFP